MGTDLRRIGEKSRREPKLVFTSLYHHVYDIDNLRSCYHAVDGRKAVGVDGETKAEFGRRLERNLEDLSSRLRRMGYRPQPKRRSYVPKPGSERGRPLGISCFEDKVVEMSLKRVLEQVFEGQFEESSHGYRHYRNQRTCLEALGRTIQQRPVNYVVEADIRSFFDTVNHEWLKRFLSHRIGDPRIIRLVDRMLKGGIMEDGLVKATDEGTSQGSVLSPLLSNIYLHYVLDLWFRVRIGKGSRGLARLFRFADDFVACFQYKEEAQGYLRALAGRLEAFGLELATKKTRMLGFGRFARERACRNGRKPEEFTFLGFTHYCGKTKRGYFKVKRRTSRKKFTESLRQMSKWAREARCKLRKGQMLRAAKAKIEGHLGYYAITDNLEYCKNYVYHATRLIFKWVNRKSQRRSYTWESFRTALRHVGWPQVKLRVDLCPMNEAGSVQMYL